MLKYILEVISTLVKKKKKNKKKQKTKKTKKQKKTNKTFLQEFKQKLTVHYDDMYQSSCLELNYLIKLNHWESLVQ